MRHWRNHATKTFLSEDVAMGYIAELNRNVENALDEAFSDAGKDFDQNTGNIIAESIMEKINR